MSSTFRDLAIKLLHIIPASFTTLYAACDCYETVSLKNAKRQCRGEPEKTIIKSEIRILCDFKKYLDNGEDTERLMELIDEIWINNEISLGERTVYFARKDKCLKTKRDDYFPYQN